jgi:hypothetical protein
MPEVAEDEDAASPHPRRAAARRAPAGVVLQRSLRSLASVASSGRYSGAGKGGAEEIDELLPSPRDGGDAGGAAVQDSPPADIDADELDALLARAASASDSDDWVWRVSAVAASYAAGRPAELRAVVAAATPLQAQPGGGTALPATASAAAPLPRRLWLAGSGAAQRAALPTGRAGGFAGEAAGPPRSPGLGQDRSGGSYRSAAGSASFVEEEGGSTDDADVGRSQPPSAPADWHGGGVAAVTAAAAAGRRVSTFSDVSFLSADGGGDSGDDGAGGSSRGADGCGGGGGRGGEGGGEVRSLSSYGGELSGDLEIQAGATDGRGRADSVSPVSSGGGASGGAAGGSGHRDRGGGKGGRVPARPSPWSGAHDL